MVGVPQIFSTRQNFTAPIKIEMIKIKLQIQFQFQFQVGRLNEVDRVFSKESQGGACTMTPAAAAGPAGEEDPALRNATPATFVVSIQFMDSGKP